MRGKNILFYIVMLAVFGAAIWLVLRAGSPVAENSRPVSAPVVATIPANSRPAFIENLQHPLGIMLLQVIVIIVAARLMGTVFRRMGQPAVIGEMAAGILLGPSLFGWLLPAAQAFVFPVSSLGSLHLLSQMGVILFMFVVGIDLDLQHLRQKAHAAVVVSHASIIVPFFLGTAFSLVLYPTLNPAPISFNAFALFMGVSMSITAFPVLARIIEERGLTKSYLGTTALACAAVDDVTAWCLLAVVVAIVKANGWTGALTTIVLTLVFIGLMLGVVKPLIGRTLKQCRTGSKGLVAGILTFVFVSALCTEMIGIHALFGAFLAGVVMPADAELRRFLRQGLESFSTVFLLPLFFAFTGLRTQIGLLNDGSAWLLCGAVIAVAIVGKLGGSSLAARWMGINWSDAFSLGVLMNTRGLVELIVLNAGYDLGILPPRIFAMMVLMALATTFMTGPTLSLVEYWKRKSQRA